MSNIEFARELARAQGFPEPILTARGDILFQWPSTDTAPPKYVGLDIFAAMIGLGCQTDDEMRERFKDLLWALYHEGFDPVTGTFTATPKEPS